MQLLLALDARGKKSGFVHCLYALAGYNGMALTPWVTLPGEKTPDVHRPFHPGPPLATMRQHNRTWGVRVRLYTHSHSSDKMQVHLNWESSWKMIFICFLS
ncbi:hypothetical protein AVEN_70026-1 [Araneus ventricosus]|uniref:Uncharacterized protein n=1 Tax=Araneus ventricosus TaxID=182803 RepID=A0A4Y2RSY9_ARAVE|nr:hypothetical protein AVEN_209074-1 [Araneus ventricosus]GBN78488.1 hypothetical protein AVEN_70026-1 [Araneus ventricosus]